MSKPDKIHIQLSCSFRTEVAETLIPLIQQAVENGRADNCGAYFAARPITRHIKEDGTVSVSIKTMIEFLTSPSAEELRDAEIRQKTIEEARIRHKLGDKGEGLVL